MQQYSKFLISNRWSKSARGFAALILIVSDDGILLVVVLHSGLGLKLGKGERVIMDVVIVLD